jgi:hypothetical protein
VPLVIAVNKCDLPDANPQRVLEELMEHGVVVEALGGDVQSVNISALTGMNIGELEAAVGALAGAQVTCFTGTKVQILTRTGGGGWGAGRDYGAKSACYRPCRRHDVCCRMLTYAADVC